MKRSARTKIQFRCSHFESFRPEPLHQFVALRPRFPHTLARHIERARNDEWFYGRSPCRIICFLAHSFFPSLFLFRLSSLQRTKRASQDNFPTFSEVARIIRSVTNHCVSLEMKAMRRRIAVHRSDRRAASSGHIFGGDNDSRLFCLRRVSFELWQRWVHMVPRLRVRGEDVVARTKPTRVVQTSGVDSDNWRCAFGIFSSRYSRTALRAKATFMLKSSCAWCEMVAQ